ncbi:MAG TPA: NUDIX domain-containing protein [Armatimonadota bacterium]|nr:NUDIX domain-containing protein [Armatimonadota bacterium]
MFTHDIYRNVRTRVIVVRDGAMLLHVAGGDSTGRDAYRVPPGGGLEPNETLFECGEREVMEETGLRVKVTGVAFLREWVAPSRVPVGEMRRYAEAWELDEAQLPDHGYGLEVYLWGEITEGQSAEASVGDHWARGGVAEWVPLEQVPKDPLFPTELKALARDLAEGRKRVGVPLFTSGLGDPWDEPEWGAFRKAM